MRIVGERDLGGDVADRVRRADQAVLGVVDVGKRAAVPVRRAREVAVRIVAERRLRARGPDLGVLVQPVGEVGAVDIVGRRRAVEVVRGALR